MLVKKMPDLKISHLLDRAMSSHRVGELDFAKSLYSEILSIQSNHYDAMHMLGILLFQEGKFKQANELLKSAHEINAKDSRLLYNLGLVRYEVEAYEEAVCYYLKSVAINDNSREAYSNLGSAYKKLGKFTQSIAAYDKAISIDPQKEGDYSNLASIYIDLRKYNEAITLSEKSLSINPKFPKAHFNLAQALEGKGDVLEATLSYQKAIDLENSYSAAHLGMGLLQAKNGDLVNSIHSYESALRHDETLPWLKGYLFHALMKTCDWKAYAQDFKDLEQKIKSGAKSSLNFILVGLSDSAELQLKASQTWSKEFPQNDSLGPLKKTAPKPKIRLGYYSADFYNHATCLLMAELFEKHDKSKFELFAFSFGPDIKDHMRTRVEAAFDQFIDVSAMSDKEIAEFSRMLGIDIAIDLKGSTKDHRFGIFSYRAAPVQVSYLGYPGTMGAEYIDYLIADKTLIPEESQKFYTEKIAYMPHSYQVNDRSRVISDRVFTKQEVGLPKEGFVFACFNSNYKITPDVFDVWVRILKSVEGSVLWLFEENKTASANLRKEAQKRGLAPERLVFAPKMEISEHLARHKLADLFIDTLPCNAHTTASDALWAGLPVLTCMGESFASRVAASLLNAIEMPELITSSLQEYEDLAIALGKDPHRAQALKQTLEHNRLTTPLFDSALFTLNNEQLLYNLYESTL
jgi:predicted O-linked N-acetylglucosamine transferase (SPINDLY family)